MKDLTNSPVHRKNILNNNTAVQELFNQLGLSGVLFEGKYRFTKQQVAKYFEVEGRTIERLLEQNTEEFKDAGYEVFTGERLKSLKLVYENDKTIPNDEKYTESIGLSSRTSSIGIFTFKAFLNIGMLLADSERARELRAAILNIVIDVLNKKLGGSTKYINQREEEFIPSAIREYNYRQEFTNALDYYIDPNKFKYSQLTDKIYISIFKENAKEYRQILKLNSKESVRSTFYSEVLDLIASYENGYASFLKRAFEKKGSKLRLSEAHSLFKEFEDVTNDLYEPLREKARSVMASRDMAFRDALHEKLKDYIKVVSLEDLDKFLGERSKALEERIVENMEVFKRLKDR